jgi:NADPH:quinone reductase-like Zn-dependent oxidoreductase
MKAIVSRKSGAADALQLQDVVKPAPKENEVLVRVHAASVTAGDVMLRKLRFPLTLLFGLMGMPRKEIPGHELAGEVEGVGRDVRRFNVGDRVFGTTTGLRVGANAAYVCLPEEGSKGVLATMPDNLSFAQAAVLPVGGMAALQLLNKAGIERGQKVLVYGASGSVGSYAVQLAAHFGATVSGVCSTRNVALVRSLGADTVLDYTKEAFDAHGSRYDVIFDAVGKLSAGKAKESLAAGGTFVSVKASTRETVDDLLLLKSLAEAGQIRPVIDRCYPLAETAAAHRYVETGRKRGNVAITIVPGARVMGERGPDPL